MSTQAETVRARSLIALAWFEGAVVSMGAISGIFSTRFDAIGLPSLPFFTFPTSVRTLFWLVAYALLAWLGWRICMVARQRFACVVWFIVLAGMLAWRPLLTLAETIVPGMLALSVSAIAVALLIPLVASFSLAASWACLVLLFWLGSRTAALIYLAGFV